MSNYTKKFHIWHIERVLMMQIKKQKNFNHLVTVLLVSINFLLFILLALVCYIAVESKRVFSKKLNNLDQTVEKNLGNLSHLSEVRKNLTDLSQISKKVDAEAIKEKIAELTVSINKLGNLEDIKQKLSELGKEFSQELRKDLSSLSNLSSNFQEIKDNLGSLKKISLQLKGLSNLQGIKENLGNLESIKNDLSKIKIPGNSKELEAIKEKLAGLEREGQELVNKFSENVDSIICPKCHRQTVISSSLLISEPGLIVKKEDWIKWVKEGGLVLKYKKKSSLPGSFPGSSGISYGSVEELRTEGVLLTQIKNGDKRNYEIVLNDNSYSCPDCKRKIEKIEGLESYKDDLPKFIEDFLS